MFSSIAPSISFPESRPLRLVALFALTGLIGACGSSSSSTPEPEIPAPIEDPEDIGDVAACHSGFSGDADAQWPDLHLSSAGPKTLRFQWTEVEGATHYRLLENPDGASGFVQVGDDITDTSAYLEISAHLHNWPEARYLVEACDGQNCQDSNVIFSADAMLGAIGCFKASNTDLDDWFGWSVALSGDGQTLAVSALREWVDARGINGDQDNRNNSYFGSGAVYVFVRGENGWQQQAYVKPAHTRFNHRFGYSLALSEDGNTLAVGAIRDISAATGINGNPATSTQLSRSGAAYVFTRDGDDWSQQAFIKASNAHSLAFFGWRVALDNAGHTLAVSAYGEHATTNEINNDQAALNSPNSGAVYVFVLDEDEGWRQQTYLKAANNRGGLQFGYSLALSGDGRTLAAGGVGDASRDSGMDARPNNLEAPSSGAVYVFARGTNLWAQQAYIKASNADTSDHFGSSVALSEDGNVLAVGAIFAAEQTYGDSGTRVRTGAAYVFNRSGIHWTEVARLTNPNGIHGERFGGALALSGDGSLLAVGAMMESSDATGIEGDATNTEAPANGATFVYRQQDGSWQQSVYVKAPITQSQQRFGQSLSLSNDGSALAVGAYRNASGGRGINPDDAETDILNSGAVYLY